MSPVATRSGAKPALDTNKGIKRASKPAPNPPSKAPKKTAGKDVSDGKPRTKEATQTDHGKSSSSNSQDTAPKVLETGVINYFVRGRVDIEELKGVEDIARGYLILRPISDDIDLTKRPLPDNLTARLLALPKKALPQSTSDRFMAFVEEPNMSYPKLVEDFLAPRDYETKTSGSRHVPSATSVGEGVYMITSTGDESHLAYISTLPQSKGDFQKTLGFGDKGSFIINTKNPKTPSPAYAKLPAAAEYPKSMLDNFGSYSFVSTKPEHLNYKNAQVLLIGHNDSDHLTKGDEKKEEKVEHELDDIAHQDFKGLKHLSSDASQSIFADLHANAHRFQDIFEKF